jgi:hypothetical protein
MVSEEYESRYFFVFSVSVPVLFSFSVQSSVFMPVWDIGISDFSRTYRVRLGFEI